MDFAPFDTRHFPTLAVRDGYEEWAPTYEQTVLDLMDFRLLGALRSVDWAGAKHAADLACGTGRTGAWLKKAGVRRVDGVDFSESMIARARLKGVYGRLELAEMTGTPLGGGSYDLVSESLADEHLPDLGPLYGEAARLLERGGRFVIVGYHPHFLMMEIATHFDRPSGESVAIESHVHLMSSHVSAADRAGLLLVEMVEGIVDDAWIAAKPGWRRFRSHPVSFAMVWART